MLFDLRREDCGRPIVLVASNDDQRRAMYAYVLSAGGFDVTLAGSAFLSSSRTRYAGTRPDVILVDVATSGDEDHWRLIGIVRSDPGIQDVPVVAVASEAAPSVRERARREGCAAVCVRTCPAPLLAEGLRSVIEQRARTRGVEGSALN